MSVLVPWDCCWVLWGAPMALRCWHTLALRNLRWVNTGQPVTAKYDCHSGRGLGVIWFFLVLPGLLALTCSKGARTSASPVVAHVALQYYRFTSACLAMHALRVKLKVPLPIQTTRMKIKAFDSLLVANSSPVRYPGRGQLSGYCLCTNGILSFAQHSYFLNLFH